MPSIPYVERITAWQTVADLAQRHGDTNVQVLAILARARLSLEADDCATTKRALKQIQQHLGPATDAIKMEDSHAEHNVYPFATAVKVEFRLIASLLAAQLGEVKEAKDLLKTTHALLDSADASTAAFSDGTVSWFLRPGYLLERVSRREQIGGILLCRSGSWVRTTREQPLPRHYAFNSLHIRPFTALRISQVL